MANEFIARNGLIALKNTTITGSLNVTAGITESLSGTSSFASTSSFVNPLRQTAIITGSVIIKGVGSTSSTTSLSVGNSISQNTITVNDDGNVGIATNSPNSALHVRTSFQVDNAGNPGVAPATTPGGSISNYYGSGGTDFLSEPTVWLKINVNGTDYVFPGY